MYQFDGRLDGSGTSGGNDKRNIGVPTKNQNSIVQASAWHYVEITPLTLYRPFEGHTPSQHPPIFFPSLISNLPRSELQKLVCVNNGAGKHYRRVNCSLSLPCSSFQRSAYMHSIEIICTALKSDALSGGFMVNPL
jgi:hypothetical protein